MTPKDAAARRLRSSGDRLIALSRAIHAAPELAFEETRAAAWLTESLAAEGFDVHPGACDLPTAFVARATGRCTSPSARSTTPCPAWATPAVTT